LYCSRHITGVMKSRRMWSEGDATRIAGKRNAYKVLVWKPEIDLLLHLD